MATNLSKIHSFLLNHYIDTINDFVGETIIEHVNEEKAIKTDEETVKFFQSCRIRL